MRTFEIYPLSNFQIFNIVLLTIVATLYITTPRLIYFTAGSLYLLIPFTQDLPLWFPCMEFNNNIKLREFWLLELRTHVPKYVLGYPFRKDQTSAALQFTWSLTTSPNRQIGRSPLVMNLAGFELTRYMGNGVWGCSGLGDRSSLLGDSSAWLLLGDGADDMHGRASHSPCFFLVASKPTSDGLDYYRTVYLRKCRVHTKKQTVIFIHPELNYWGAQHLSIKWLLDRWLSENPVYSS